MIYETSKMQFVKLVICISTCAVVLASTRKRVICSSNHVEGYYWRDYMGEIPQDAIPGGHDAKKRETYIGQTLHRKVGVIVPGKIVPTEKKMYFEFDNLEHPETEDVKILCSQNPEHFRWIKTGSGVPLINVTDLTHLVIGGHDRPHVVGIGRTFKNDELQVGKVIVINSEFEGIHLTKSGVGWKETSFEVLVYEGNERNVNDETYEEGHCDKLINIHFY